MMKINDLRTSKITLKDLKVTDQIGFIDNEGEKGFLVYVGDGQYVSAVGSDESANLNCSYGEYYHNKNTSVEEALRFDRRCASKKCEEVFVFPDRKSLYKWLSE